MPVVIVNGVAGAKHVSLDINGRSHFVEVGVPASVTVEVFDALSNSSIAFTQVGSDAVVESNPDLAVEAGGDTPEPVGGETGGELVDPAVTGEPGDPVAPDTGESGGSDAEAMAEAAPAADAAAVPDATGETAPADHN